MQEFIVLYAIKRFIKKTMRGATEKKQTALQLLSALCSKDDATSTTAERRMNMTNCKDCTTNCVYRGKDNEARCGSFVGTVTNADRIRAMNDEELADVVANGVGCVLKAPHCMDVDCTPCILKWLKQPFEGE